MDATESFFQSPVISTLSVVAATVIFIVIWSQYRSSQCENPTRYHVEPPEAVKSAHQKRPSETLTPNVRSWQ